MLPPVLSILLYSDLPASHSTQLRVKASDTLSHLLTQHSTTYPSLSPRIMKTLLLALLTPGKSKGTREGAVRGLGGVGKEAVRKGLLEGGGARMIGLECAGSGDSVYLIAAVMVIHSFLDTKSGYIILIHLLLTGCIPDIMYPVFKF